MSVALSATVLETSATIALRRGTSSVEPALITMRAGMRLTSRNSSSAHADGVRRLGRLHRLRRDPRGPGRQRPAVLRQLADEPVGVVVGQQDLRRSGGEDHRPVHLRIEVLELVAGHAGEADREDDVDVVLDRHAQEVRVVVELRQLQVEARRPADDVLHRLQLRHVALRLGRHAQAHVVGRPGRRAGSWRSRAARCLRPSCRRPARDASRRTCRTASAGSRARRGSRRGRRGGRRERRSA